MENDGGGNKTFIQNKYKQGIVQGAIVHVLVFVFNLFIIWFVDQLLYKNWIMTNSNFFVSKYYPSVSHHVYFWSNSLPFWKFVKVFHFNPF